MRGVVRSTDPEFDDGASVQPSFTPEGHLKVASADGASGAPSDAAWSGAGDGTVIALLKAIHARLASIETNTSA